MHCRDGAVGRHRENESFWEKVVGRLGDLGRIRRRLRQESFDTVVLHTASEMANYSRDIPLLWLCRHLPGPRVVQFHGSTPELALGVGHGAFKQATRALFRCCEAVLVLSHEERRQWEQFDSPGRFFVTQNAFQPVAGNVSDATATPGSCHRMCPSCSMLVV